MTQQEFVKKESEAYAEGFRTTVENPSWHHQKTEPFKSGLTKGLEIAKEFAEWTQIMKYKQSRMKMNNGEWFRQAAGYGGGEPHFYTTSELLTIFLTEKYGNNG